MVAIVRQFREHPQRHAAVVAALCDLYWQRAQAHGCRQSRNEFIELLKIDIELNAQGLQIWVDKT
jgi:hypothetical protein